MIPRGQKHVVMFSVILYCEYLRNEFVDFVGLVPYIRFYGDLMPPETRKCAYVFLQIKHGFCGQIF